MVSVEQGKHIRGQSTNIKPTNVPVNSTYIEVDTDDLYRLNDDLRWDLVPPIALRTKRLHTLFMPNTNQTGLIFGDASWTNVHVEIHNSGCMVYQIRTSASVIETFGQAALFDVANVTMLPRFQMVFSFNSTNNKSAAFIGFCDDVGSLLTTSAAFIPSGSACIGIGYKTTDTTYKVYHNDSSGAVNSIDTTIARDTNVYMIEVDIEEPTSQWVRLYDINMNLVYGVQLTTQIPGTGIDIGFKAIIVNVDIADEYCINMFDYVRIEKTKPPLSATMDF